MMRSLMALVGTVVTLAFILGSLGIGDFKFYYGPHKSSINCEKP